MSPPNLVSLFVSSVSSEGSRATEQKRQSLAEDVRSTDDSQMSSRLDRSQLASKRVRREATAEEPPFLTGRQLVEKLNISNIPGADSRHLNAMEEIFGWYPYLSQGDKMFACVLLISHLDLFQDHVPPATYTSVRNLIVQELDKFKEPIRPNMHVIWVGSLPDTVKTSIRIFLESTPSGVPLTFYLGYDPRGYLAFRLKASIYRTAQSYVNNLPLGQDRDRRYWMAVINLQNEAYNNIKSAKTPEEFSQKAIDFMVSRLGGDRKQLEQELQKAKESFVNFENEIGREYPGRVKLVDLSTLIHKDHPFYEYYLKEMWLRGNIPSAADMARPELLSEYGGTYIDADVSPMLQEGIFGMNIEYLGEEILEFIANTPQGDVSKWRAWLEAAKVQAVHNFIAKRPHNGMAGLFSKELFERMQNDEMIKNHPAATELVSKYIRQIEVAPVQYLKRMGPVSAASDVKYFFQPFKQPAIFPNGLSMQERPGGLFGYDIGVLHGREGAPAFRYYQQLVISRYQELEKGGVMWEQTVPQNMDNNLDLKEKYNGYYRLDGLVEGMNVTEYITGPRSFSQAAIDSFGKIRDENLMKKWEDQMLSPQDRRLFPLFVESTVLQFDTPEDVKSAWRGQVLPRKFSFAQPSKYTTQIVLQLDHNARSTEAARFLDNRQRNSRWLVLDENNHLVSQDTGEQMISDKWEENTRIVLVGTLHDDRSTISGQSPMKVAEVITQLMPKRKGEYPVARIKIVGWSLDPQTGEGISSGSGVAGMKGFSSELLGFLKKKGMPVKSIKGYEGPVEIDIRGRTWVLDSRGLWRHKSASLLRFLVEEKDGQPIIKDVPIKNLFDDVDVLPGTPALSVGRPDRRAVMLIVSRAQLKSNKMTEFREAVENLRIKHPQTEFYALTREDNGRFKQWKYVPVRGNPRWSENWHLSTGFSQKEYDKILLLGHGNKDGGGINGVEDEEIARGISEFLVNVSKIEHLGVLVCGSKPEFGMMLYDKLRSSTIGRITGSALPVYIAGKSPEGLSGIHPGSRLYRDQTDGRPRHGVNLAKWEVKKNAGGQTEITSYLLPSRGDGVEISETQRFAGPFAYAQGQQALAQEEEAIKNWRAQINKVREHVISNLRRTFYENVSDLVVVIPNLGKKDGKFSVPVVNLKTQATTEVEIPQELGEGVLTQQKNRAFSDLRDIVETGPDGALRIKEDTSGHVSSMNGAFFALALFRNLDRQDLSSMSAEEKFSMYWNLAGMGVGVGGDGVQLAKTVSQLMVPSGAVERSVQVLKTFGGIFEGANMGFMAVAIGLDAYELATTDNPVKRVGLEIGLGFNSAALGIQGSSAMVSWLFPAAAEAAGGMGLLAVPLMGIGIGATALGTQIAQHNEKVHQFYKYFNEYFQAIDAGVYLKNNEILVPAIDNVPIAEINYRTKKIRVGTVRLEKSEPAHGGWIQTASGAVPYRRNDYFDLLKPEEKIVPLDSSATDLVLSEMPPVDISYDYVYSAMGETAEEKAIDKRFKTVGEFEPSNSWGNLRPEIKFAYGYGTQNVILDEKRRVLHFISRENNLTPSGRVHFMVEGGGGSYILQGLHSQLNLTLKDWQQGPSSFLLSLPDEDLLGENDVSLVTRGGVKKLVIQCKTGALEIDMTGMDPHSKITISGTGKIIWGADQEKVLVNMMDLRTSSIPDIEAYLNNMMQKGKLRDLVALIQGPSLPVPLTKKASEMEKIRYENELKRVQKSSAQIAYDTRNRRILTPGNDYLSPVSPQSDEFFASWAGTAFVAVTEKHAFFFDPIRQRLIQTDRLTNKETASFRLRFCSPGSRIEGVIEINGEFVVKQVIPAPSGEPLTLLHLLKEDKIQLIEVSGLNEEQLEKFLRFPESLLWNIRNVNDEGIASDRGRNFLEVLAIYLGNADQPFDPDLPDLSTRRAEVAEWLKIRGGKEKSQAILLNLGNAYSIPMNAGDEEFNLVKSWSYPSSIGGMGLVIWSPRSETAKFVKLKPGEFTSAHIFSRNHKPVSFGINPPVWFHGLAKGQKVVPFEECGQIYLVSKDGTEVTAVDHYGAQTSWQYHLKLLPLARLSSLSTDTRLVDKKIPYGVGPTEGVNQYVKQRLLAA